MIDPDYIASEYGQEAADRFQEWHDKCPDPENWILYEGDVSELVSSGISPLTMSMVMFGPVKPQGGREALIFLPASEGTGDG